jgi:hypothetical protein
MSRLTVDESARWVVSHIDWMLRAGYDSGCVAPHLQKIRGSLRHALVLPDNCATCEGLGTVPRKRTNLTPLGAREECKACSGTGRKEEP